MTAAMLFVRKRAKLFAALGAAGLLAWRFQAPLRAFLAWVNDREALSASIGGLGPWGPLALFGLLVAQVFLAVIPGHALMVTGGYVFGFWPSLLITLCSTVLGSQIAFLIARRWGRSMVYRLAAPQVIQRWDRLSSRQGALFYLFAFLLPIFPSDLMCYVAGLGAISARRFLLANVGGRLVCAALITLLGATGFHLPPVFWAGLVAAMLALFAAWRQYARRHRITLTA
jgi:uncharacterized membrane protein YdjX (TVP38/TMEM64 family)